MNLEGFVRVTNNSGEEYEDAQVRLVVGRINLVQKIAELARIPANEVEKLDDAAKTRFRGEALRKAMESPVSVAARPPAADKPAELPRRLPRRVWASISSIPSKAPRRSATAGRSGCGAWRRPKCR